MIKESARDSPMITFGRPMTVDKIKELPGDTGILLAMIFDNTWDNNFVANSEEIPLMDVRYVNMVIKWGMDMEGPTNIVIRIRGEEFYMKM